MAGSRRGRGLLKRIGELLLGATVAWVAAQGANVWAQQQPSPYDPSQQQDLQRYPFPAQTSPTQPPRITNTPPPPGPVPGVSPRITVPPIGTVQQAPAHPEGSERAASEPRLEFQDFVAQSLGRDLPVYGHDLFVGAPTTFAPLDQIAVPADYVIGPGDEIMIRGWGQVDIDYRAVVDRDGRIYIPKVGSLTLAGIQYQNLDARVRRAVSRVFKNFELNVSLGQLRSIQIFIVGQARRPGSYIVSSLSTLVNALFASGGPSLKGSMRSIQLKRGNTVVTEFDLYDLLQRGDKSKDAKLLPGDVIFIPPVGRLAAVSGSVNVPGIYELKPTTTAQDLITMAGGLAATAGGTNVTLERIVDRKTRMVDEIPLQASGLKLALTDGDLVHVYTLSPRIRNAVTLRGNVAEIMRFPWKDGMRVKDVIPEADALVVPGYWIRKNTSGRSENWLRNGKDTERRDVAKLRNDLVRGSAEINWDYAVIERFDSSTLQTDLIPFNLGRAVLAGDAEQNLPLMPGDIITVFSVLDIQVPLAKQAKYVRLEGEFAAPGVYQIVPGENLRQLIARVGGVTGNAYIYGAEFTRESTKREQQQRLNEAIDRLELEAQRASIARSQGVVSPEEAQSLGAQAAAQGALIAKLRNVTATGRIVLGLPAAGANLNSVPELPLEDGDRLYVPPQPGTVSVFGAVYNQNAYLYETRQRVSHYLDLAGGPTKDADKGSIYLVRADGSVISSRQRGWFGTIKGEAMMPGDAVVVPESFDRFNLTKELKDWTQILYQLALGVAGLKVLNDL
jgi:polysaccharide biosynthesis/export protein